MQYIKNRRWVAVWRKGLTRAADGLKVAIKFQRAGRTKKVITDLVPRGSHWTPALRPGVQHLLMAKSGRHAPL